jgi:hypothetical protein
MTKDVNFLKSVKKGFNNYVKDKKKQIDECQNRDKALNAQAKGELGQLRYRTEAFLQGKVVQKTGRGHDYKEQTMGSDGRGHGPYTYVEVKQGPYAKQTAYQKEIEKELPGRYKVKHYGKKKNSKK